MITVTLPRDPDSRHLLTFQACFLVVVRWGERNILGNILTVNMYE